MYHLKQLAALALAISVAQAHRSRPHVAVVAAGQTGAIQPPQPTGLPPQPIGPPQSQSTPTALATVTSQAGAGASGQAGASGGIGGGAGGMTIAVVNHFTSGLSVSYGSNAGGPGPIGNPTPGPIPSGSTTTITLPTGWAGRVYVGSGPTIDPQGSKIEGSTTGPPDIDVSYVDGYSVPIVCSVNGSPQSGCNIDLFANANTNGTACSNLVGDVCHNSAQGIANGPAPPFFAPCVGAAYTFPNDNVANVSDLPGNNIVCVIGTQQAGPARQGKEPNQASKRDSTVAKKRSIQTQLQRAARQEQRLRARAGGMLNKRHEHKHEHGEGQQHVHKKGEQA